MNMTSNPFTEWPLWHYFTTHMQNIAYITNDIRRYTPSGTYVLATEDDVLAPILEQLVLYDFMQDEIRRGDIQGLYVVPIGTLISRQYESLPRDIRIVVKGRAVTNDGELRGGEFIPLIGTPGQLRLILQGISEYQKGQAPTGLATLKEQMNLEDMMDNPKYGNSVINAILKSYTRVTGTTEDNTALISKISRRLSSPVPEGKAINVTRGSIVTAASTRYTIQELSVSTPGESTRRVVKFAFPTTLKPDERARFERLLVENFNAQTVAPSTINPEERSTIAVRPLRLAGQAYEQLFLADESFSSYINNISRVTESQTVDVSQVLHTEITDVPDEEDDLEDEDIDEL